MPSTCWPSVRGKSQSLDPLTFEAAIQSRGFQQFPLHCPPAGKSSNSEITLPPADSSQQQSVASGVPYVGQPQAYKSPQTVASTLDAEEESERLLGPLPEGWERSFAPNGDPYFIDHIKKETTWLVLAMNGGTFILPFKGLTHDCQEQHKRRTF